MNCKQGDLAIVTGAQSGDDHAGVASRLCLGRIVRVAKLCEDGVWDFEETIHLGRVTFIFEGRQASADVHVDGLHDGYLCPIAGLPRTDVIETEILNPLELALGITAKDWT